MPLLILIGAILIISGVTFVSLVLLKRYGSPNPFVTIVVCLTIGLAIAYLVDEFSWHESAIVTAAVVSLPLVDRIIHG